MSVEFCPVLCYKCTWYFLAAPQPFKLTCTQFLQSHVYLHVRLILHDLGIPLPHEDGFSKVKNAYIKSAYYSVCDDHGVNADETWMHGDWFYTTGYGIFGHEVEGKQKVSTR